MRGVIYMVSELYKYKKKNCTSTWIDIFCIISHLTLSISILLIDAHFVFGNINLFQFVFTQVSPNLGQHVRAGHRTPMGHSSNQKHRKTNGDGGGEGSEEGNNSESALLIWTKVSDVFQNLVEIRHFQIFKYSILFSL